MPTAMQMNYPPATRGKVVVWGYLGSYPFGGMTWQVLHYVAGLRALGFDVWYVEDTDAEVRDPLTLWDTAEYGPNVAYLDRQMTSIGLADRWIFRPPSIWIRSGLATGGYSGRLASRTPAWVRRISPA